MENIGTQEIVKNPDRFKNLITNFNDDVLVLRDNTDQWLTLNYAEFLGTGDSINSPLSNGVVKTYETNQERQNMLNQNKNLKPAKVIAIYDLDGKIVNSDFRLDNSEFGDGSYDDRQTVINNALNTVIVNQTPDLVFYKENNGKNTLVKNEVNEVYELTLNNKNYYYPTFSDAKNELISYIKNNCVYI